ncbi:glycosyl transferase [Mycolicibacterium cyprinidarum]|uniref:Glycosyl transferase n=1 Tax=Mycolicibacterium cyprinidarum TaxID=2860311 RepID=A0ABQ4VCB2_9MYCO|nr:glycosyl transferase [Mycolicibacterium sp. NGTWS1803]GJF12752.1 glycosyl transferase [Mycolicibacterium sp. NGTWS0302]GJF14151.1 glycosyl transferase [Mycolicibacterium sp. NGTWSNA01]
MTVTEPAPVFAHLLRMTDHRATFEHACLAEPRREGGYRTSDMAGVLVVTTREPETPGVLNGLAGKALTFLNDAQAYDGTCRNRMDLSGRWTDKSNTEDHWGRMIWSLGTAAAHSDVSMVRRLAVIQFDRAANARSPHPRAMAFAAVGAAEILTFQPGHATALRLLTDYAAGVAPPGDDTEWPWPEQRLTHANAVLAEAMIAAGVALDDPALRQRGLDSLEWLLTLETLGGHLSPTPVGGRSPGDDRPAFDQQPIEVATLADACARAATVDPRPLWPEAIRSAVAWFQGVNDAGLPMWDPETGGGFDALHADAVSLNQGAESTLAVISTLQQARRFAPVPQ